MQTADFPGGYVGLLAAFNVAVGLFVDPDKGRWQKWFYWGALPVIDVAAMTLLFGDLIAGIGLGGLMMFTMTVAYFRYRR